MRHRTTTAPTTEPISLIEAKAHLRVDVDDDDAYIAGLISAARKRAEDETGLALAPQTITLTLDRFPCGGIGGFGRGGIELPRPPLIEIDSFTYIDSAGAEQELVEDEDFYVTPATESEPAVLRPAYGTSWPSPRGMEDVISIVYRAGYAAAAISPTLKQAMLLLVGHWYANREETISGTIIAEVPMAAKTLLAMSKVHTAV